GRVPRVETAVVTQSRVRVRVSAGVVDREPTTHIRKVVAERGHAAILRSTRVAADRRRTVRADDIGAFRFVRGLTNLLADQVSEVHVGSQLARSDVELAVELEVNALGLILAQVSIRSDVRNDRAGKVRVRRLHWAANEHTVG